MGTVGGPGGKCCSRLPMFNNLVTVHIIPLVRRRENKDVESIVLLFLLSGAGSEIEGQDTGYNDYHRWDNG